MPRKSYSIEQIVSKLREVEVHLSQGQTVGEVCRSFNISEQTYYRWRKEYGGICTDQVHRLKELERENAPKKAIPHIWYSTVQDHRRIWGVPSSS